MVSSHSNYDEIREKHENLPTRPKRKNTTALFSIYCFLRRGLSKYEWLCDMFCKELNERPQTDRAHERTRANDPAKSESDRNTDGVRENPAPEILFPGFLRQRDR